jgi:hypothetical protein
MANERLENILSIAVTFVLVLKKIPKYYEKKNIQKFY